MNKLTDEKLEKVMAMLAAKTALDEASVNDIASSPQLWWSVQRNIAAGQETADAPWPPPKNWWRTLAFVGVPSLAGVLIVIGFFVFGSNVEQPAIVVQTIEQPSTLSPVAVDPKDDIDANATEILNGDVKATERGVRPRDLLSKSPDGSRNVARPKKALSASEEIKSEFIALTYAGNPESGQLVRVKVPSSMMVNLGLVDSVDKPTRLVDAEVVVGDDGQTHAIRFIRQSAN